MLVRSSATVKQILNNINDSFLISFDIFIYRLISVYDLTIKVYINTSPLDLLALLPVCEGPGLGSCLCAWVHLFVHFPLSLSKGQLVADSS